jgi:hypothetical protein
MQTDKGSIMGAGDAPENLAPERAIPPMTQAGDIDEEDIGHLRKALVSKLPENERQRPVLYWDRVRAVDGATLTIFHRPMLFLCLPGLVRK